MVIILLLFTNNALERLQTATNDSVTAAVTAELYGSYNPDFRICHLALINVFPLLMGCFCYLRIFYVVRQTAQTMGSFIVQRSRNPSKLITASVAVLLSSTSLVWSVYITCTALAFINSVSCHLFMYIKIIIFMLYPVGEGLFLSSAKTAPSQTSSILANKSRTNCKISPVCEENSYMDDLPHPALQGVVHMTISEKDDSNISDLEGSNCSLNLCQTAAEVADQLNEPQPSGMKSFAEEINISGNKDNAQTAQFVEDIENEIVNCEPSHVSARFYRRGSGFSIYNVVAQDSPVQKKTKQRHTFELMSKHMSRNKISEPATIGLGFRKRLEPSGIKQQDSIISSSLYENIPDSPSLSGTMRMLSGTKEGYSGLRYAQQTDICTTTGTIEEEDRVDSPRKHNSPSNNWIKAYKSVRNSQTKFCAKRKQSAKLRNKTNASDSEFDIVTDRAYQAHRHRTLRRLPSGNSKFSKSGFQYSLPTMHVQEISDSPTSRAKVRSISCVNNVYSSAQRSRDTCFNKTKKRNKSVSFVSSVYVHDNNESSERRSIEVGSEIKVEIEHESEKGRRMPGETRERKKSSFELSKMISRKTSHWMLDKATPRQECIAKLQEIHEYF